MKKVVGLTGGIGSGKSTVRKILADLGAYTIDMDKLAHRAYEPGTEPYQQIAELFGDTILSESRVIDRAILGEIVFNDADAMNKLTAIVWPAVHKLVKEEISLVSHDIVVVESALLVESGDIDFDQLWVVSTSQDKAMLRLRQTRGMTEDQALVRINSQMSDEERCTWGDVILNNDDDIFHLTTQVKANLKKLREG